jgi:hypothetical protein
MVSIICDLRELALVSALNPIDLPWTLSCIVSSQLWMTANSDSRWLAASNRGFSPGVLLSLHDF